MVMYLYRAIRDDEYERIQNKQSIVCSQRKTGGSILDEVTTHIRQGSSKDERDCWISTCKNFDVCAKEYAIPQIGNYNTAKKRKRIICINTAFWGGVKRAVVSDNYTVLCRDNNVAIDFEKEYNRCGRRYIIEQDVAKFKEVVDSSDIDSGLFDCSMRTESKLQPLNRMSLIRMSRKAKNDAGKHYAVLGGDFINGIYSGVATSSKEVLALNEIPYSAIDFILEPIEQDIVYAILQSGQNINVALNEILKIRNNGPINGIDLLCVDTIVRNYIGQNFHTSSNIKNEYANIVNAKKNKIKQCVSVNLPTVILPEDSIQVIDLDCSPNNNIFKSTSEKYDLLLYKKNGMIRYYRQNDFIKSVNADFQVKS